MTEQPFYREAKFQLEILKDRIYASTAGEDDEIAMARASRLLKELEIRAGLHPSESP
ncbi:hypothetical protein [Burkholderia sp. PAMC 28687]|uniref:hypothetical protein n=1 Tax=Burkholderia sp. PAMC 28687 TaxID=1795874 RepID=UPI000B06F3BB|nr:hypothetical protein [Burkholderia sp. PAMC 28687]